MNRLALTQQETRTWSLAGGVALVAHIAVAGVVLAWVRPSEPPVPDPVVLVELPPQAASAPSAPTNEAVDQRQTDPLTPQTPVVLNEIPAVRAPLPSNPVTLPPPSPPQPARKPAASPPAPSTNPVAISPTGTGTGASATPGNDSKAKKQEADYFALVSAHLNRRKTYPAEARQARQQGVVTVRFTVDRSGSVSGASIKRSSGHEILDRATLDLLQRVAPLPRMPASMQRDSVTLSLPIDYSLRTS